MKNSDSKLHPDAYKYNTRKSKRTIINYESRHRKDYSSAWYPHMLIEDFHLGLWIKEVQSTDSSVRVRLEPQNKELERILCSGLETRRSQTSRLASAVFDFVEEVAQTISYFGKAYYEIVYFYDNIGEYKSLKMILIPPNSLRKTFNGYEQLIPSNTNRGGMSRVAIPADTIVYFRLPKAAKKYLKIIKNLARMRVFETPQKFLDAAQQKSVFDYKHYREAELLNVARLTRHMGWNARESFKDHVNEFYLIHRHLKFRAWLAEVREQILVDLNGGLAEAGIKMGFESKIVMEGLSTSSDIRKIIEDLNKGHISFSDALKQAK